MGSAQKAFGLVLVLLKRREIFVKTFFPIRNRNTLDIVAKQFGFYGGYPGKWSCQLHYTKLFWQPICPLVQIDQKTFFFAKYTL